MFLAGLTVTALAVGPVVEDAFVRSVERAEPDDDDMHVSLAAGFAFPGKRPMGEVNLDVEARKQFAPQRANLLTLGNGIR